MEVDECKEEKTNAPVIKQSSVEMDHEKEKLVQFQKSFHVSTTAILFHSKSKQCLVPSHTSIVSKTQS